TNMNQLLDPTRKKGGKRRWIGAFVLVTLLLLAGLLSWFAYRILPGAVGHNTPSGPAWFADVTDEVGLDFVHDAGPTGNYFMPQAIGSGVALFDFDRDGRLDIYLIQNAGPQSHSRARLFRQRADGHF